MPSRTFLFLLAVTTIASPAFATNLGGGEELPIPWLRIVLSFLICGAIACAAILMLRRRQSGAATPWPLRLALPRAPERVIGIVETRRVSQHGDACLLRCRGKAYLLLVTPHQAVVLDTYVEDGP